MDERVGTIISTEETPTSTEFAFTLEEPVRRGQFVEFETDEGLAVARIGSIRKTNMFFMNAESVSESVRQGRELRDHFPTDEREYLVAEGRILGVYQDSGLIKRPSFPPSPGTAVGRASTDRLADFLGLDLDAGIDIGRVQFQDLDARLNLTKTFQKHLAILAQSGAGKSYLASVMIEELLDRDPEDGQLGIVALDPHGEYAGFGDDPEYADRVEVYDGTDIRIGVPNLSAGKFQHYFSETTPAQKRELDTIISDLRSEMNQGGGAYDLDDIRRRVEEADINSETKEILLSRIGRMQYMDLFSSYDNPGPDRVEAGKMIVLDLSDIVDFKKKQIIAAYFSQKLFNARRKSKIPPYFFLVEEAHNFAPENAPSEMFIASSVIKKIAREGRKFHASLGLISQRPVGLSTTALSQCNTHIILRVTNPNDQDRIRQSSEGITTDVMKQIPGLKTGECVVVGEAVDYPTFIDVRERRSEEFDTGKDLESVAQEYAEMQQLEDDDIEKFL